MDEEALFEAALTRRSRVGIEAAFEIEDSLQAAAQVFHGLLEALATPARVMIRVTPAHGVPYILTDPRGDGSFTQRRDSLEVPLSVPMWVLFTF